MRILLIEDDREASDYLARALTESGHSVEQVEDGMDGLHRASKGEYDALVVDRMLPSLDGLSLVETLRKAGKETPILFLSALGDVDERVKGLRSGGDDYLVKPYAYSELLARLELIVVRKGGTAPADSTLRVADLEMDLLQRTVTRGGKSIELKPREFRLLEFLMKNAGRVVTRTMLLENVWDLHFNPQTNVIDVHISRLRQRIDKDFDVPLVHTVRGAGYCLRAPE